MLCDRPAQSRVEMILQKTRKTISKFRSLLAQSARNLMRNIFSLYNCFDFYIQLIVIFFCNDTRHSIKTQFFEEYSIYFPLKRMFLNGKFAAIVISNVMCNYLKKSYVTEYCCVLLRINVNIRKIIDQCITHVLRFFIFFLNLLITLIN